MNAFLLNRQLGSVTPQALTQAQYDIAHKALEPAEDVSFRHKAPDEEHSLRNMNDAVAHPAGVNSIAIDRFEGRYLISAGADSSIAIWDLEEPVQVDQEVHRHFLPISKAARTSTNAALGITHISFYPFDSLAFLTSGYDHTVKLFSSETLVASASFDLESIVYSHAMSTVAPHLLVACASQHPAVRLVDLNSGAYTHSLAGHAGSVLAVAWHPKEEHILASAATDGVIRLWDIRKSANSLSVLDMDDSIGIVGYDGHGTGARRRERGKAHRGAVNGIVWTEDGRHLVSVGHDECMRVWDMISGANTLANFGPALKNATTTTLLPLIAPRYTSKSGSTLIYYPNPKEILSFDLHSGSLQKRLRVPNRTNLPHDRSQSSATTARNLKNRTTSLAWRPHNTEMYSAHGDGTIRCWQPRTREDVWADEAEDDQTGEEAEARKRKREEFDLIIRDLTRRKITFN